MSQLAVQWTESLMRASIQGGLAIAILWLIVRVWKGIPAKVQVWAWRLILVKLFVTLLVPITVQKGLLTAGTGPTVQPLLPLAVLVASALCALLVGGSLFRDLVLVARLKRSGSPCDEASMELTRLGREIGLTDVPKAFTSDAVDTPMLVGCGRSVVLLPTGFLAEHGYETWRMVLAHELAHFARRDLWWMWLSSAVRTVFFFHPLAHLALAELHCAEEAACDDAAVRMSGASRVDYGLMLVGLSTKASHPFDNPVAATAVSRSQQIKRRIHIFVAEKRRTSPLLSGFLLAIVLAAVPGYAVVAKPPAPDRLSIPAASGEVFAPAGIANMSGSAPNRERRNTLIAPFPEEGTR